MGTPRAQSRIPVRTFPDLASQRPRIGQSRSLGDAGSTVRGFTGTCGAGGTVC
jgi:hypothetical protein